MKKLNCPIRIQRSKSFPTAKEAKEFASKVEYQLDTGQYSYTRGRTLEDVLLEWLEVYCVHLRPNSLADMESAVKIHIMHDLRHTVVTYMLDAGENPRTV